MEYFLQQIIGLGFHAGPLTEKTPQFSFMCLPSQCNTLHAAIVTSRYTDA